jgi:hypothetical protein
MATPFTAVAHFRLGSPTGPLKIISLSATDVANEYYLFPSGNSTMTLSNQPVYLTELLLNTT